MWSPLAHFKYAFYCPVSTMAYEFLVLKTMYTVYSLDVLDRRILFKIHICAIGILSVCDIRTTKNHPNGLK